jgi:hypothetical protein
VSGTAQERRREIDTLKQQNLDLQAEVDKYKKIAKGHSSRKVSLENEIKEVRAQAKHQMQTLLEKAENDDKLIKLLKDELDRKPGGRAVQPSARESTDAANQGILRYEIKTLEDQVRDLTQEL